MSTALRPIETAEVSRWLAPRPANCHKGDFGKVGVLGGACGMAGAGLLAARAALWLGAGRVYAGLLDDRLAVDPVAPEVMICSPEAVLRLPEPGCLVIGPGLGTGEAARQWLVAVLETPLPLLLDADALNILALDPELPSRLKSRSTPTLLTPHPGEAARLLGSDSAAVQADREGSLQALAARFQCGIVLKGRGTLVRDLSSELWCNTRGNSGLAAPGMGDVLAGMIAALTAQGLDLGQAAVLGVHLHGVAADQLVANGLGPVGLTASELARAGRDVLNDWIRDRTAS